MINDLDKIEILSDGALRVSIRTSKHSSKFFELDKENCKVLAEELLKVLETGKEYRIKGG